MRPAAACLAWIALAGAVGCGGAGREAARSEPALERSAALMADSTNRSVFVVATRDKPRIVASLEAAGIRVATDLLEAGFLLRVTVGSGQGAQSCGTRHNVKYSLRLENVPVVELAEKGYTGTCTPNVFDVLSARLAEALEGGGGAGSRDAPRAPC